MKIEQFAKQVDLISATEITRVALIAFYFSENKDQPEFSVTEICNILVALGFARPNSSRLKEKLKKSKNFVKGSSKDTFRLSLPEKERFKGLFPDITESEEIISDDTILPEILFDEIQRLYLQRLVKQINASYENNLFDATALMMRRLLEILLIHVFEKVSLVSEVQDSDGNFDNLKTLINKAKSRSEISLSAAIKKSIDQYRELGNLSAHRVKYNCRRDDIRPIRMEYRAVIEELLYKAGLKK